MTLHPVLAETLSAALVLSREVHSSLRGRAAATVIRPLSFREFLRHRGEEPTREPARWTAAERSLVEKRFREFLTEGGFPEAQGHGLTKDAVHAMLDHLTDAFLVAAVPLATESERQRNSNPRKLYPADPGLIGAFDTSGRSNIGHALESAVMNELDRRGADVGYVRTGNGLEVDFHARYPGDGEELVQVCADPSSEGTLVRELAALEEAAGDHPRALRRLLVLDRDARAHAAASGASAQPAYEWLLARSEGQQEP